MRPRDWARQSLGKSTEAPGLGTWETTWLFFHPISWTREKMAGIVNRVYSHANKTHFHKKSFALSLVLKERVLGTRKRPTDEHNGVVHTYQDIFENRDLSLFSKKKSAYTRSVFESFSPFHSKTLTDDRNTIASFTGHALYEVWRHRIENLRFRSSTRKKYARFFLKKIHSGTAFSKSGVSSARNRRWRVDGKLKRRKISVFKIPRYAWMGKKYWS